MCVCVKENMATWHRPVVVPAAIIAPSSMKATEVNGSWVLKVLMMLERGVERKVQVRMDGQLPSQTAGSQHKPLLLEIVADDALVQAGRAEEEVVAGREGHARGRSFVCIRKLDICLGVLGIVHGQCATVVHSRHQIVLKGRELQVSHRLWCGQW